MDSFFHHSVHYNPLFLFKMDVNYISRKELYPEKYFSYISMETYVVDTH